jgi:hypothetical protein
VVSSIFGNFIIYSSSAFLADKNLELNPKPSPVKRLTGEVKDSSYIVLSFLRWALPDSS